MKKHTTKTTKTKQSTNNKTSWQGQPILLAAIMIGLLVIGTAAILYMVKQSTPQEDTETNLTSISYDKANKLRLSGDVNGAVAEMDAAIAAVDPADAAAKGKLYEEKAQLLLNQSDYTQALVAADKAEELAPTINSANLQAEIQFAAGNKQQALDRFKVLLQRLNAAENPDPLSIEDAQSRIDSLEKEL